MVRNKCEIVTNLSLYPPSTNYMKTTSIKKLRLYFWQFIKSWVQATKLIQTLLYVLSQQ